MERLDHVCIVVVDRLSAIIHKLDQIVRCNKFVEYIACLAGKRWLTLCKDANGLTEVARLAIRTPCVFEHTYNEAKLAQKTMLTRAVCSDMRLSQTPYGLGVMHHLQNRIRVRVGDVGFQPTVFCAIVKAVSKIH